MIDAVELEGLEPSKNTTGGRAKAVAETEVSNIEAGTSARNFVAQNTSDKSYLKGDMVKGSIQGGMHSVYENSIEYVSDTKIEKSKFNMFVSNAESYNVDESNASNFPNYEIYVVSTLMSNFVTGEGPENYNFPANGIISNLFLDSEILSNYAFMLAGGLDIGETVQVPFSPGDLIHNTLSNGLNPVNITGFVGSGTLTVTQGANGITVTIFNITSLTSGALAAKLIGESAYPTSTVRVPDANGSATDSGTPYGNISQTFTLFFPSRVGTGGSGASGSLGSGN